VDEAEWLTCTDPLMMFEFVRGKVSDRKLRLYLCGGCRQIAHLFFRPESITAVEVAERFADGEASLEELDRAEWDAESPTFGYEFEKEGFSYSSPYKMKVVPRLVEMGALPESALSGGEWQVEEAVRLRLLAAAALAEYCAVSSPSDSDWGFEYVSRVDWPGRWLFDCVFGNPFRSVALDPAWLGWNDGCIVKLAKVIYHERAFSTERMGVLADALEDAGCADRFVLGHLRGPGPHVRGCFVVDLILAKE
jgi:hypothetical protein